MFLSLVAIIAVLMTSVLAVLVHRHYRLRRVARTLVIDTPTGILEERFVRIGGIEQWISIRGEDRANPVLLELHGGPGASNTIFIQRTRAWEKHFTVIRWDMRGAGKTFGRGSKSGQGELTVERVLADAIEVTDYVRRLLAKEKVILLASSFGSIFGLRLARRRPDLYAAYVGTDQNLAQPGSENAEYLATMARLRAACRRKDVSALERIGSDSRRWSGRDWALLAKLSAQSDPRLHLVMKRLLIPSLWFSPQHRLRDLRNYVAGMNFSAQLFVQAADVDPWREGTRFTLPFFLFQGEYDELTPVALAQRFIADVEAPVKEMALIRDANHFASFWQPEQFLQLLLTRVHPRLGAQPVPVPAGAVMAESALRL